MGEQRKDSETEEAATFSPFLRNTEAFAPADRLQMAESVAAQRHVPLSPLLRSLILQPENFLHHGQQSAKMADDAHQRRYDSHNSKREAFLRSRVMNNLPLPSHMGMNSFIDINPTKVTLSLEFESQYYPLMTNEYGEHENVASIMAETETLIQLPDQMSDGPVPDPLIQQVSITGLYSDVDRARRLMRDNCHVSVFMSLSEVKISNSQLESIVHQNPIPNVEMQFCHTSFDSGSNQYHLRFTSRAKHENQLIAAATTILDKSFDGEPQPANQFSVHFTLSTYHVEHVIGQPSTSLLMPQIEQLTDTKITYPPFYTRDDLHCNRVEIVIVGEAKNVLEARKHIIGLLPISISFNMKNTDMAVACGTADRWVNVELRDHRTMMKMKPSMYEPNQLLADEVQTHCVSLRSKEFNIKNLYAAYRKMLAARIPITPPEPDSYDNSVWHRTLPFAFFFFSVQCRGESPDSGISTRRHRTTSMNSGKSKRSNSNRAKVSSESAADPKVQATIPTSETPMVPFVFPAFPQFGRPLVPIFPVMLKGGQYAAYQQFAAMPDMRYAPELLNQFSEQFALLQFAHPINEVEHGHGSAEVIVHRNQQTQQRKINKNGGKGLQGQNTNFGRTPRVYEQVREEDVRLSMIPTSRRTSVSGDEPTVGSYEDKGHDRPYHRQYPRYPREDRWKTGRGEMGNNKRNMNIPYHKEYRNNRDNEYHFGSYGSEFPPVVDHKQFQETHHLSLKPKSVDLEHEQLFTHDTSFVEDQVQSPKSYATAVNSSFEQGKRSRTPSVMDKNDMSLRFTDSEGGIDSLQCRSVDSYKNGPPCVTKTMLEPRYRLEKNYSKVSLEHKGKPEYPATKFTETSSFGTRMDPMKLIASVHESSEQLPIINERQFNDVLNDKERAAASMKNLNNDSTLIQDPSFDESSSMNNAFRHEKSSEQFQ